MCVGEGVCVLLSLRAVAMETTMSEAASIVPPTSQYCVCVCLFFINTRHEHVSLLTSLHVTDDVFLRRFFEVNL